ncbi:hypothetical protein Leryth_018691 [Lithospermum erythrorhizon]|nr:hypothetical protein Leryth_018691 [Lithospermum erythrorhizon]
MDRLSDLPDVILQQIYSWMPTEEFVRTSVLSKRWNGLWLSSPSLFFDLHLHNQLDDFYEFINRTLIFRGCSRVKSFRIKLFLNRNYTRVTRHLDLWVRYALQNETEQLFLDLSGDSALYRDIIHQVVLGCSQLQSLELLHCVGYYALSIYSTSLKRLAITDSEPPSVYISGDDLEISAPNIESICMSGDLYRKCLLTNLSSLLQATLYFYGTKLFNHEQDRLLEVLESLEHVENLKLGEWCIKVLAIREKKGLPCRPLKCKSLVVNTSLKQEDIPGILLLLKCSPDLETLTLNITSPEFEQHLYESEVGKLADFSNFAGDRYLNSQVDGINCLQLKLRTINITHFVEQNLLLPFIKFMLREARVLKNMEIRSKYMDPNSPLNSLFNVARELSDMPKSSPNVVVKLHNSNSMVSLTIF